MGRLTIGGYMQALIVAIATTVLSTAVYGQQDPNEPPQAEVVAQYEPVRSSRDGTVFKVVDGNVTCYFISERHRGAIQPVCVITSESNN